MMRATKKIRKVCKKHQKLLNNLFRCLELLIAINKLHEFIEQLRNLY